MNNMPYPIFPTPIPYNNHLEEELIKLNQEIIQLPCNHYFDKCIETWLRRNSYCPLCHSSF